MRGRDAETDGLTYAGANSGCKEATEYLGHQSSCLECPFDKCILEESRRKSPLKRWRDEEVQRKAREGATEIDLAEEYQVSLRTIQRILSSK